MEYVSVRLEKDVYDALLRMQALLQYRDKKKHPFSTIVRELIKSAPEIEVPIDEELRVVFPEERKPKGQGASEA